LSAVILSEAKDLRISLRVNCAKDLCIGRIIAALVYNSAG